jgi:hypothetical protein
MNIHFPQELEAGDDLRVVREGVEDNHVLVLGDEVVMKVVITLNLEVLAT